MKNKKLFKQIVSFTIALMLIMGSVLAILPLTAFAAEPVFTSVKDDVQPFTNATSLPENSVIMSLKLNPDLFLSETGEAMPTISQSELARLELQITAHSSNQVDVSSQIKRSFAKNDDEILLNLGFIQSVYESNLVVKIGINYKDASGNTTTRSQPYDLTGKLSAKDSSIASMKSVSPVPANIVGTTVSGTAVTATQGTAFQFKIPITANFFSYVNSSNNSITGQTLSDLSFSLSLSGDSSRFESSLVANGTEVPYMLIKAKTDSNSPIAGTYNLDASLSGKNYQKATISQWYGFTVKVNANSGNTVPVTSVSVKASTTIPVGGSEVISATISPSNATNKTVKWSSSNTSVATVDSVGRVTGVKIGTSTITATSSDSSKTDYCWVTVSAASSSVYKVTFNLGGGTRTGGGDLVQNVRSGLSATQPTVSRNLYQFTGWDRSFSKITENITVYAQWKYIGASSSSSSSSTSTTGKEVSSQTATDAAKTAAAAARKAKQTTATVTFKSPASISLDTLKAMTKAAGMPVTTNADSLSSDKKAVDVRITIPNAYAKNSLKLSASTYSTAAKSTANFFGRWYKNNLRVVHFDQTSYFGQTVEIAAKVSLSGFNTNKLYLYSYSTSQNKFTSIQNPAYWIDKSGYLHFNTSLAGDIIISEGVLVRK